jgi:threonine/homoserine/homoserine lactone efflux protein
MLFTILKWLGAPTDLARHLAGGVRQPPRAKPRRAERPALRMLGRRMAGSRPQPQGITFFVAFLPHVIDQHADFWTQMADLRGDVHLPAFANVLGYRLWLAAGTFLVQSERATAAVQSHRRRTADRCWSAAAACAARNSVCRRWASAPMDFDLNDEQRQLKDSVERLLADTYGDLNKRTAT